MKLRSFLKQCISNPDFTERGRGLSIWRKEERLFSTTHYTPNNLEHAFFLRFPCVKIIDDNARKERCYSILVVRGGSIAGRGMVKMLEDGQIRDDKHYYSY